MSRRAVILAGGKGTRLHPFTVVLPKPLMPVGEYPILEIIIRQLVKCGFTHITMAVNHLAEIIQAFFGDGSKWNIRIDYSFEDKPMGTIGPLKLIPDLPENFLIMNGDVLTNLPFDHFLDEHCRQKRLLTICAIRRLYKIPYGVLDTNDSGHVCSFVEKPEFNYLISSGIYAANKNILHQIPDHELFGFDHLILQLIQKNEKAFVFPFEGKWLDIGSPDDYSEANRFFDQDRHLFI